MKPTKTYSALGTVGTVGLSIALLTGAAAPANAQDDQLAQLEQALSEGGYDEVSCEVPEIAGNEAVVPDLSSEDTFWVVGSVTADVGEDRPFSDLSTDLKPGDRLSIVGEDGGTRTLVSAGVCSALVESGDIQADTLEGNLGGRPYAIAVNGIPAVRPGLDPATPSDGSAGENPVVETDEPAATGSGAAPWAGVGALLSAVALGWGFRRGSWLRR